MKKRQTEEQIVRILRESASREVLIELPIKDFCGQHDMTEQMAEATYSSIV